MDQAPYKFLSAPKYLMHDICVIFTFEYSFILLIIILVDLMDLLREIPGREALKVRAEVSHFFLVYDFRISFWYSLLYFVDFFSFFWVTLWILYNQLFVRIGNLYQVASMASQLRLQRIAMDKKVLKISEFGISVWRFPHSRGHQGPLPVWSPWY